MREREIVRDGKLYHSITSQRARLVLNRGGIAEEQRTESWEGYRAFAQLKVSREASPTNVAWCSVAATGILNFQRIFKLLKRLVVIFIFICFS